HSLIRNLWKSSSRRAAPRRRAAAARPGLEQLDARLVPTVFVTLTGGQLQATGDNVGNLIVVQHSGSNTVVNAASFAESAITSGILIKSGLGNDTVNILSTVKPITVQGQNGSDKVNLGDQGKVAGIVAPVTVLNTSGFTALTVNDANGVSPGSFSM